MSAEPGMWLIVDTEPEPGLANMRQVFGYAQSEGEACDIADDWERSLDRDVTVLGVFWEGESVYGEF